MSGVFLPKVLRCLKGLSDGISVGFATRSQRREAAARYAAVRRVARRHSEAKTAPDKQSRLSELLTSHGGFKGAAHGWE